MKYDFTHLSHPTAGIARTRHVYYDGAGVPVLVANRYEHYEGGTFFLPFDVIRNEWKAPRIRPLYKLARIASAGMNEVVIVVEGEKCADALAELGYLVTTTFGGCKALAKSDLTPLAGRSVIIWPDHDDPGNSYAQELAERLNPQIRESPKIVPVSES